MREIVLDTETTGFNAEGDDRIVEIGAIELINHLPTANTYHVYINPERSMPAEAFAVHGLGDDFLSDKQNFRAHADGFLKFIGTDSKLIIHNASFDMKFLNAELKRNGCPAIGWHRALDTVALAREKYPGSPASLDALCRRFGIDNSNRELHGALLDSELLAAVYLELIGGRQPDLILGPAAEPAPSVTNVQTPQSPVSRPTALPPRLTEAEIETHTKFIEKLGEGTIWARYLR